MPRWQRTEERRSFLGGEKKESRLGILPKWAPDDATTTAEHTPNESEFFDYAANERLMDRLGQLFVHMMVETNIKTKVSGISEPVALTPAGIVSLEEFHANF